MRSTLLPPMIGTAMFLSLAVYAAAGSPGLDTNADSATVTGKVKLEGVAPKPKRIEVSADPNCAKMHPSPMTEDIVTDSSGDVENVVVYISDGLGDRTFDPPAQPAVLEQKGCRYTPHVVAMRAGQTLRVVNDDGTTHNIHPMPSANREWNKSQPPGLTIEEAFARPEVAIPVRCNIHPWMRSYIAVFKHPYFAVTADNGSFDLKNLPPGTYTVQAWHEKLGMLTQKITVGPNETKTLDLVFKARPGM